MSQEDHKLIAECKAIRRTAEDLAPLSEHRIKLMLLIFGGISLLNTLLLLAILITVIVK